MMKAAGGFKRGCRHYTYRRGKMVSATNGAARRTPLAVADSLNYSGVFPAVHSFKY